MEEWKEYISVEWLTFFVAVATLFVSILAYRYARKSNDRNKREVLARKKAKLKAMENVMNWGIESSVSSHLTVEIAALKSEIEQIESSL